MQPVPELAGQVVNVLLGSPDNIREEIEGEIIKP